MAASTLAAGETLQAIAPAQNMIVNAAGDIVGIRNTNSTGADFRGSGGAANNAATISGNTTLTQALHDSRTIEVTASCTLTLNADATDGWVPPSAIAPGSSLYLQCAAGVNVTWAGTATIGPSVGASYSADSSVARLIGLDHSLVSNTWIVTSVQIGVLDLNATDITATRAIAASDFGTGVLRINAAGVVALTLPTVASLGLTATPGKVRTLVFQIIGAGIPTFAGATASTSINGVAGTTAVTPIGGAPVQYSYITLTQTASGSDTWSLTANTTSASSVSCLPMSTPVAVPAGAASNTKSCFFSIPAGSLGAKGSVRITVAASKTGANESVGYAVRMGAAGFAAFSTGVIVGNNNTGAAATGTFVFEAWLYANGADTTTLLAAPPGGAAILTTNNPVTQNTLTLNHGTTAWEIGVGGDGGATTGTWVVTNATCTIYKP